MQEKILFGLLLVFVLGCGSPSDMEEAEEILTKIDVNFKDRNIQKIYDHQDRLEVDSLLPYFKFRDPTYRYLAASAMASIQDPQTLDTLATLLSDPVPKVRQAAAYALGQLQMAEAESKLIQAFQNHDTLDANSPLNETILEAIGKCGSINTLVLLSEVTTYQAEDKHLLLGQARAIYRFMLRGIVHLSGTQRMINILADPSNDQDLRLLAANYLARADIDLQPNADLLTLICTTEKDPEVLLFLPQAIIKTNSPEIRTILQGYLRNEEQDYRVKCNAIRAMAKQDYDLFRRDIHRRLYDANPHVAGTAGKAILDHGKARYWREYMNLTLDDFAWPVKINLLHAVNKYIPGGNAMFRDINDQKLQQRLRNSNSEYEQATVIVALGENLRWYRYIIDFLDGTDSPVLKSAAIKALVNMIQNPAFDRQRKELRQSIVDKLMAALNSGDVGQVEIATGVFDIDSSTLALLGYENPKGLLQLAIDKLELPRDMEAHIALNRQLAKLNGTKYDPNIDLVHTHRIDWSIVNSISDTSVVQIKTTKGEISVQLLPDVAPGTVANFVDLARLNYFAAKSFHRVVPVFVIQAGCSRGDGYGSMDYNIRSELGQAYYEGSGYLGMASAGKHTESAQWFITNSATPHLDGKYTIFGKVTKGLDVVHAIEVGDQIEAVNIN